MLSKSYYIRYLGINGGRKKKRMNILIVRRDRLLLGLEVQSLGLYLQGLIHFIGLL
jgi:hypothetical protein